MCNLSLKVIYVLVAGVLKLSKQCAGVNLLY